MSHAQRMQAEISRRLHDAWDAILATEDGRLVLHDLLGRCGLYSSTYADGALSAYLEGRRSVALDLLREFLLPQGARCHAAMLIEAEDRAMEIRAAEEADERERDV